MFAFGRIVSLGAALAVCSVSFGAIVVHSAYYHVDIGQLFAWSEGAPGLTDFAKTDRRAGLLKVYVWNTGKAPVCVKAQALNGQPLSALRENERHEVIWWRTLPQPVPPGALAEISVRLRYPLEREATLTLQTGSQTLEAKISPTPPPFRLETISWSENGRRVWIVAQQNRAKPGRIVRILLDDADVTKHAVLPAPGFAYGLCPIVLRLPQPLTKGSVHTYGLINDAGQTVCCTLRTLEEFLQLGIYGGFSPEEAIKAGLNTITHFATQSKATLDRFAAYGLRNGFYVGQLDPAIARHPATYAYYLHDEPDCWDYSSGDWPPPFRIGYRAPDCIQAMEACLAVDPITPVGIVLDLTYKPANYYVYAQIPDIVAPDCYPLAIGQPLTWVREVTETCRLAAGPRRVEIIPQVCFEDRKKQEMKFRRPPFEREVVIQYLYALGAGARGFSAWEAFDEDSDFAYFHGAPNYPDVWQTLSDLYARFKLLEPLILQAHPTQLAHCDTASVWTRTLVCGLEALLLVLVNDAYETLPNDFRLTPQKSIRLRLPKLPWLKPAYAGIVRADGFQPLPLKETAEGTELVLPELDTGALILLAKEASLPANLLARLQKEREKAVLGLLSGLRFERLEKARHAAQIRYIMGRYKTFAVEASALLNAYGTKAGDFFNPEGRLAYPAIEYWTEQTPRGGEWKLTIPPEQAGQKHTIYFQTSSWWGGGYLRLEILGPQGATILSEDRVQPPKFLEQAVFTPSQPGEYTIRLLHAGAGKPGGRLSRLIYVVPESAGPIPAFPD